MSEIIAVFDFDIQEIVGDRPLYLKLTHVKIITKQMCNRIKNLLKSNPYCSSIPSFSKQYYYDFRYYTKPEEIKFLKSYYNLQTSGNYTNLVNYNKCDIFIDLENYFLRIDLTVEYRQLSQILLDTEYQKYQFSKIKRDHDGNILERSGNLKNLRKYFSKIYQLLLVKYLEIIDSKMYDSNITKIIESYILDDGIKIKIDVDWIIYPEWRPGTQIMINEYVISRMEFTNRDILDKLLLCFHKYQSNIIYRQEIEI